MKEIPLPHLIISDIMMDGMNGYVFKDYLNNDAVYRVIPFMFLSAKAGRESRIKGHDMGAVDYIEKPFHIMEIESKIDAWITLYENRDQWVKDDVNRKRSAKFNAVMREKKLTEKDKEVVSLMLEGKFNDEIADLLGVSDKTINNRIAKLYKKMGVRNKTEIVKLYFSDLFEG